VDLMFGLDNWLVHFSDGTTLVLVVAVAVVLGLRHASDPDHLAAVTTLVTNGKGGATRLGLTWGLGHASSLVVLGVPIVLWKAYLPPLIEQSAEVTIGLVIVALALWLLVRWRRGGFVHDHTHLRVPPARTPWQAFGIGLVHGIGGSGGVGILLLAAIHSHALALVALVLFAACTAVSMAMLSTGFGLALGRPAAQRAFSHIVPVFGVIGLCFGTWYALGALTLVPYVF
jgi:high-affinity nickel permease